MSSGDNQFREVDAGQSPDVAEPPVSSDDHLLFTTSGQSSQENKAENTATENDNKDKMKEKKTEEEEEEEGECATSLEEARKQLRQLNSHLQRHQQQQQQHQLSELDALMEAEIASNVELSAMEKISSENFKRNTENEHNGKMNGRKDEKEKKTRWKEDKEDGVKEDGTKLKEKNGTQNVSENLKYPRKSLPLLPRIDQYEKHPLLQTRSKTGITEFEMLMIEKELLKRRKSMEERGSPDSATVASAAGRRRTGGSLRQQTTLIPRSAHYEPHPLLKKSADGVFELERILQERQQQKNNSQATGMSNQQHSYSRSFEDERQPRTRTRIIGRLLSDDTGATRADDTGADMSESEACSLASKDATDNYDDDDDMVSLETTYNKQASQTKRVRFQKQKSPLNESSRAQESKGNDVITEQIASPAAGEGDARNEAESTEQVANNDNHRQKQLKKEKSQSNSRMDFFGKSCCLS